MERKKKAKQQKKKKKNENETFNFSLQATSNFPLQFNRSLFLFSYNQNLPSFLMLSTHAYRSIFDFTILGFKSCRLITGSSVKIFKIY